MSWVGSFQLAQLEALQLAGLGARQLLHEGNLARVFVGGHGLFHKVLQVLDRCATGNKTGAIRKTPLMRVADGKSYVLVGSIGGAPDDPVWVHNLRANPDIELRDATVVQRMRVREVTGEAERARLWGLAVAAYPPYEDYQKRTSRRIPVFVAMPV